MQYEEIAEIIESIGYPTAYRTFLDSTKKKPPYIVYYYIGSDDLYADNINYQEITGLRIELYLDNKNFEAERTVESVLKANGIAYDKEEVYLDDQRMYEIVYESEVVING